jgi:formamidopyrimidine-DNA glycosylase
VEKRAMPEGPEVQTIVNGLRRHVVGRRIAGLRFIDDAAKMLELAGPFQRQGIDTAIIGQTITGVTRRNKYIDIALESGAHVLLHLMMTGRLVLRQGSAPLEPPRFLRFVLTFEDGAELCLGDQRKWARLVVLPGESVDEYEGIRRLGVDVMSDAFTFERFSALLGSRRNLHGFLLDQAKLAGLGNIYANEALFHAGLHPLRTPNSLDEAEARALHRAIREVTAEAVRLCGTTFSDFWSPDGQEGEYQHFLQVFRRAGESCRRCGAPIERLRMGNRGAFYCPQCQPLDGRRK